MPHARIIINVSDQEQSHSNGLSGAFTVPGKKDKAQFGMLVIYDRSEIQDDGENRRHQNWDWARADELAKSIIGIGSHSGSREKWGLLLCEASPDLPRDLEKAILEETMYLNRHVPQARPVKDSETGATVLLSSEPESVTAERVRLSERVQTLRQEFERDCRKLVTVQEVTKAKNNLLVEDERLVREGDEIWAGPEAGRANVNELHKRACLRLGQERPWCYQPQQLVDCPGCGAKIKENILTCPSCTGWLDEGIEELRGMRPKERAMKMYPERYAEPVGATGKRA